MRSSSVVLRAFSLDQSRTEVRFEERRGSSHVPEDDRAAKFPVAAVLDKPGESLPGVPRVGQDPFGTRQQVYRFLACRRRGAVALTALSVIDLRRLPRARFDPCRPLEDGRTPASSASSGPFVAIYTVSPDRGCEGPASAVTERA